MTSEALPVGGSIFTRAYKSLVALSALGILLIAYRFAVGLGTSTAMSDGYPWGIWIALDVVTGTAFACGGYAMALLVYIFNKGKYHPLVRPAILTSALGYTMAGLSVMIDLGRPWNTWRLPIFTNWNVNSALLEVALCIMAYVVVLWIELSPAILEGLKEGSNRMLRRLATAILPALDKALIWIIALGVLLPTMHQSSLGALMLLTGPKLNPLWQTPFLPFFFLMTCIAMGYAAVIFETAFSSAVFKRKAEFRLLVPLQKLAAWGGALFVFLRLIDVAARGRIGMAFRFDLYAVSFWVENILFVVPLILMFTSEGSADLGTLFRGAILLAFAGGLYRFNTFLVAYDPGPGWHYFPSVPEIFISVGLVALELAVYVALVRRFPILGGLAKSH